MGSFSETYIDRKFFILFVVVVVVVFIFEKARSAATPLRTGKCSSKPTLKSS